jgi:hypothetical protein
MKNFFKARIAPLFVVIALVAVIGFSMAACDDGGGGGGGDKRAELVGEWVKDGGSNYESIDYDGTGKNSSELLYFRTGLAGGAQYYVKVVSYDGTTVKAGDSKDAFPSITFTATIANGKLTLNGLSTSGGIDLSVFNGTYTKKQP